MNKTKTRNVLVVTVLIGGLVMGFGVVFANELTNLLDQNLTKQEVKNEIKERNINLRVLDPNVRDKLERMDIDTQKFDLEMNREAFIIATTEEKINVIARMLGLLDGTTYQIEAEDKEIP